MLIPHKLLRLWSQEETRKGLIEGLASYQVVGEVMAHQAYDG